MNLIMADPSASTTTRTRDLNTRLAFRFSVDSNVTVIHRSVYNSLMFVGEMGGLLAVLFAIYSLLFAFLNF